MRNLKVWGGAVIAAGLIGGMSLPAAANERGLIISYSCSGCHGVDFNGATGMPLLRGRPVAELTSMMIEFRSGQRYSTVMGRLTKGLDEADIRAVSEYLSALK